ncbi:metal ABC transporter permease [Fundicoccus culcitae]|uniref:Metal ABC transporter permease n=1 Tax=Fundicoccus culcitae TaxID=2969821 RepID=A0ABY5P6X9_9LACT|nr:metal ABC transporter permease [Fundicoccus culcitae]UUX34492.1 metal ABC transporter permease [Fundicoccus culcitae]
MIFDYFFWVVALGTMILGFTAGVIGTTIVIEKQSQLGDTIGHAVYPGIIAAFMIFQTRKTIVLLAGAIVVGLIAFWLIQFIQKHTSFAFESILALVLSSFFSLGLLLYSVVQNNPAFQTVNFAGLKNYIMGQAAYMVRSDVELIIMVCLIVLAIFILFYPKIKITLFDKVFAQSIGINQRRISQLLLLMSLFLIVVGLQAVGAILISSMLVAPATAAKQWTNSYPKMLIISGLIGMVAAFIGTLISTYVSKIATGPMIVIVLSLISLFSILLSPNGWLFSYFKHHKGGNV